MNAKPILAFDCSATGATLALCANGTTTTASLPQTRQSAELVSAMDGLMRAQNLDYTQLGAIISTTGPGSFTGLRVGLAALHGLALAANVPIKTLTSLHALAWAVSLPQRGRAGVGAGLAKPVGAELAQTSQPSTEQASPPPNLPPPGGGVFRFLTHLRAGKGEMFVQPFALNALGQPEAAGEITLLPETTSDWKLPCYGNLAPADSPLFLPAPDASVLCAIAHHLPVANLADAMPLYIRPPDAKIPSVAAWLA